MDEIEIENKSKIKIDSTLDTLLDSFFNDFPLLKSKNNFSNFRLISSEIIFPLLFFFNNTFSKIGVKSATNFIATVFWLNSVIIVELSISCLILRK